MALYNQKMSETEDAYLEGMERALAGEPYGIPPYFLTPNVQDRLSLWIEWHRGFMEHVSPDPACPKCGGTGVHAASNMPGVASKYRSLMVQCGCNTAEDRRLNSRE